MNDNSPEGSGF